MQVELGCDIEGETNVEHGWSSRFAAAQPRDSGKMTSMRCEKILLECILFVLSCGTLAINYVFKQLEYCVFLHTVPEILLREDF